MKSFDQYTAIKDLAESILDHNIDIDQFCESILDNIEENGVDNLDEFYRPISSLARGAMGILGGLGGAAGDAGSAMDKAATRIGQKAAGYGMSAMDKARSMGRSAYDRASSATQAVGKYASDKYGQASDYVDRTGKAVKQYASDKYQQGARAQAVKQIEDRLHGLRDAMSALGISPNQINSLLRTANKIVLQSGHELSPNIQSSFAPQAPRRGVGGRFTSGA
jgi:hypothetical protein